MRYVFSSSVLMFDCVMGSQIKVWLGENADHYYVLSRFLVSRMLLVTKVLCVR